MAKKEKSKEELFEGMEKKSPKLKLEKPISKISPQPAGKGQGKTGVSKNTIKETIRPEQKENDFIDDIKVNEIIKPDLPPKEDTIVDDISEVTKGKLKETISEVPKFSPEKPKSDSDEIEDIIKSVEKEVDTINNVKGASKADDLDRTSEDDLIEKLTKKVEKKELPTPVKIIKASELDDTKRVRLEQEEDRRRKIESERRVARASAKNDEDSRRGLFNSEIEQMTKEFNLLMDEKYPEFSRRKNIKGSKKRSEEELRQLEIDRVDARKQILNDKQKIKIEKKKLNVKKVDRLKNEKKRKEEEQDFKVNRLRKSEVQTFFEGDILLEQKEKTERNPDIKGESEVQIKRKELDRYEKKLGRKIVPHRDIIESEESDFDDNSNSTSEDTIIKVPMVGETMEEFKKLNKLINIRRKLDKEVEKEEIFAIKKIREPKPIEEPIYRKTREN